MPDCQPLPTDQRRSSIGGGLKRDIMDILACPGCRGGLVLTVEVEEDDEVIQGSLECSTCDETYPIIEAIPNLLPPSMRSS